MNCLILNHNLIFDEFLSGASKVLFLNVCNHISGGKEVMLKFNIIPKQGYFFLIVFMVNDIWPLCIFFLMTAIVKTG